VPAILRPARDDTRRLITVVLAALVAGLSLVLASEVRSIANGPAREPHLAHGCRSSAPRLSILMVGNSYTAYNDLPGEVASVLCRSGMATNVRIDSQWTGGTLSTWAEHAGAPNLRGYDVVVLQDQSQVPSFGEDDDVFDDSRAGVAKISQAAAAVPVRVVLFETWAHHDGDERNRELSPDYSTMQVHVAEGYDDYLAAARDAGALDAGISRVGDTWSRVRERDHELFDRLYEADGSHPSSTGTYLAALVLAQTVSGRPLPAHPWFPPVLLLSASTLRSAAGAA
jgi:hypothetical protein